MDNDSIQAISDVIRINWALRTAAAWYNGQTPPTEKFFVDDLIQQYSEGYESRFSPLFSIVGQLLAAIQHSPIEGNFDLPKTERLTDEEIKLLEETFNYTITVIEHHNYCEWRFNPINPTSEEISNENPQA